jgi:predicted branched-subunit amino acid permease
MGLSIALATGLYGISFGALGVASGLTLMQTQVLSLVMFTGGSQFAFVGAVAAGGAAATIPALLVGLRNSVYAAHLNGELRPSWRMRPLVAQVTIDESFGTAVAQADPAERRRGFWVAGVGVFVFWNLFTLVGALVGDVLGDPQQYGLDGAAVAAFLGLLWPRLKNLDALAVAVIAALVAALATPLLPAGLPMIAVAVVVAVLTLAIPRWRDGGTPDSTHPSEKETP